MSCETGVEPNSFGEASHGSGSFPNTAVDLCVERVATGHTRSKVCEVLNQVEGVAIDVDAGRSGDILGEDFGLFEADCQSELVARITKGIHQALEASSVWDARAVSSAKRSPEIRM